MIYDLWLVMPKPNQIHINFRLFPEADLVTKVSEAMLNQGQIEADEIFDLGLAGNSCVTIN